MTNPLHGSANFLDPGAAYTRNARGVQLLSGTKALVAALTSQATRDRNSGLRTAGFVSGYRGSPLGHVDEEMWAAEPQLAAQGISFQPGVNEDLAATAIWGTQQVGFFKSRVQGVFGLWYGKGPGLDRSGDALRHANLWGTSEWGGVVMAVGDDPMARSSSIQQQSEIALSALSIPTFSASSAQDIHDYCLIGWQLSRYAGVWTAIKLTSDVAESSSLVDLDSVTGTSRRPTDHEIPEPGVHIRWPDTSVDQDKRLATCRLPAVHAFIRVNQLNRTTFGSPARCRLGIIAHGKAHADTIEALSSLGIDSGVAIGIGLAVYKLGVIWPLEPVGVSDFAASADELLVIEEGRAFVEPQVKAALFDSSHGRKIVISGKLVRGKPTLPSHGELTPALIARAIAEWLGPHFVSDAITARMEILSNLDRVLTGLTQDIVRTPHFCSGCPHNSSTLIPIGSNQLAGIGCHTLAMYMDRGVVAYPQMGGEGVAWVGASRFVENDHVFVNVGDGSFYHSGSLAIRQAIAAKVNATYKILYNGAVAMTGGQPIDGPISVHAITFQMKSEGASRVLVVSDNPQKYDPRELAPGTGIHHRDELPALQIELRQAKGVSVIIYEQTCATELRRRRKRGLVVDPPKRVFINDRVCEGCGDCGIQSNCLSIHPLETGYGRKRTIDQSSCNKDISCVKGFCPSFVTVEGGALRKPESRTIDASLFSGMPTPQVVDASKVRAIAIAGIGGTGVVTIARLLGMAAGIQGLAVQILNLTGMSQKFGAVLCHVKVGRAGEDLGTPRIASASAELLLGADLVASTQKDALSILQPGVSRAVINDHGAVTGRFTRDADFEVPRIELVRALESVCGSGRSTFHDVTRASEALTGDTIWANMMLLGIASQLGLLPVSVESIESAIKANGLAVADNLHAFRLGRLWVHDRQCIDGLAGVETRDNGSRPIRGFDELVAERSAELREYQDQAYADRYLKLVRLVSAAESRKVPGRQELGLSVAEQFFRLLAYKDEYEVARLFVRGRFLRDLKASMSGKFKVRFHLAPPIVSRRDRATGRLVKREYGSWVLIVFRVLVRLRFLRGSPLDPFGRSPERREERRLIREYEESMKSIATQLSPANHATAVAIARLPGKIRGYGHVKSKGLVEAKHSAAALMKQFCGSEESTQGTRAVHEM